MITSKEITNLNAAFVKAQAKFPAIEKNREGQIGNRKFKYAELDKIRAKCDPILNDHGLFVTHAPERIDGVPHLTTRLEHSSGEWKESSLELSPENAEPKSLGMLLTYLSRYGYTGILGLATAEDLDAPPGNKNPPQSPPPKKASPPPRPPQAPPPAKGKLEWGTGAPDGRVNEAAWKELQEEAEKHGWSKDVLQKTLKNSFGYSLPKQIKMEDAMKILDMIKTSPKK